MSSYVDVTQLLEQAARGQPGAFEEAIARVYDDLSRMARQQLGKAYGVHLENVTLEPRALTHETFLRLLDQRETPRNRAQLLGIASRVMLRALVDYQRERMAQRRGGGLLRVTLSGMGTSDQPSASTAVAVAEAMEQLEQKDPRKAEVAKLRTLWGFTHAEIAELLDISEPTVEREWRFARAWLARRLR
jgi:RNA polymerase sigma factor (TIGR02999 family)